MMTQKDEEGTHYFYEIDNSLPEKHILALPGFDRYDVPHGEFLVCWMNPKRDLYPLLRKQGIKIKESDDNIIEHYDCRPHDSRNIDSKRHKKPTGWK